MKKILISLFAFAGIFFTTVYAFASEYFFWEDIQSVSSKDSRFPKIASNGKKSCIFWQEVDTKSDNIWISCRYKDSDGNWLVNSRFAGPFKYSSEVPDLYSAVYSHSDITALAALTSPNEITVYLSYNGGKTFEISEVIKQDVPAVAPRIYVTSKGRFIIFTSRTRTSSVSGSVEDNRFYLFFSTSSDGKNWSKLEEFSPASSSQNSFAPVLCSNSKGDFIVYQAQYQSGTRLSYQLYSLFSSNGGNSWQGPYLITGAGAFNSNADFMQFQNQRPNVYNFNDDIHVAWERRPIYSDNDEIWVGKLTQKGMEEKSAEQVAYSGNSKRSILFSYKNRLAVCWFDTRNGFETVYMAVKNGLLWNETRLSKGRRSSLFAFPLEEDGILSFVWQVNSGSGIEKPEICILSPDVSVKAPAIYPQGYKAGSKTKNKAVRYNVVLPQDSSDIAGFSYSWSQNIEDEPSENDELLRLPSENKVNLIASEEGKWYFKVRAKDYAGNWSKSVQSEFNLDLTSPKAPVIADLQIDENGFLNSNTFAINWNPDAEDKDVVSYIYKWEFVSPIGTSKTSSIVSRIGKKLLQGNSIKGTSKSWYNLNNGVYLFSVQAVDDVGHIGQSASVEILLNKYIPHTVITGVNVKESVFGEISIDISGNDFLYGGTVLEIFIDRDGKKPYDRVFSPKDGYKVSSNTLIQGVKPDSDIEEGSYYIGLVHSVRGVYKTVSRILKIEDKGTVKIDSGYVYKSEWTIFTQTYSYNIYPGYILFVTIMLVLAVLVLAFGLGALKTAKEISAARILVRQIQEGAFMSQNKLVLKQAAGSAVMFSKRKGSLRFQMIGFTLSLVAFIIMLVAVPLGVNMIKNQSRMLAEGLKKRADLLMASLSSGVKTYMPVNNILELSQLPDQSSSMKEVIYTTITGFSANENASGDLTYVWASNDPSIKDSISTKQLEFGISKLVGQTFDEINEKCLFLNEETQVQLGDTVSEIVRLNQEGSRLALRSDSYSTAKLEEISLVSQKLINQLNKSLDIYAQDYTGSIPEFSTTELNGKNTDFMFYRPVLYRQGASKSFVRGIVLLKIDTTSLLEDIRKATISIIILVAIISAVAIAAGTIGALALSSVIVRPIKKLEEFVRKISEEKHKDKLAGASYDIQIKRNDEIGRLGDQMNRMKEELASAAREEKLANDGKAVQQAFLPLINDGHGYRQTIARLDSPQIECFGYYEGASAVSGDYFDYKKLDDRWYVLIKCDASGHGVPAALIMTVVATLFRKYFENWTYAKNGIRINELVTQINDLIESIGLKGKFATIITVLFDTKTGDAYLCNAGDNIIHIYDSEAKKEKIVKLFETPAAGPLPSFMVDMKGGFKVEKINLKHGDVLFLYTDGIEESTRIFRDSQFNIIACSEEDLKDDELHANHKVGSTTEQMEPERVRDILESVFARKKYILEKFHNPVFAEKLEFDFTTCAGTIEEAIIALASVEKVFRMYKRPEATASDTIRVDKKIDEFLKKHFNLYGYYCRIQEPSENSEDAGPNYVFYNKIQEDEQADDLTLLAVRRP